MFNGNFSYIEADQSIKTDKLVSTKGKKIYFIRFVETADKKTAWIKILNDTVVVPNQYAHQFVFVEWDIEKEQLLIYSEYNKVSTLIYECKFTLNL